MNNLNRPRPTTFVFENQYFEIHGGPIANAPGNAFRVRLAPEVPAPAEVTVAVPDFGVPSDPDAWRAAALKLIRVALKGKRPVYTGCRGGIGRTGMMIATIAKIMGEPHPVRWTRIHFRREAVETTSQEQWVAGLDVSAERDWLLRRARLRRLTLGILPW